MLLLQQSELGHRRGPPQRTQQQPASAKSSPSLYYSIQISLSLLEIQQGKIGSGFTRVESLVDHIPWSHVFVEQMILEQSQYLEKAVEYLEQKNQSKIAFAMGKRLVHYYEAIKDKSIELGLDQEFLISLDRRMEGRLAELALIHINRGETSPAVLLMEDLETRSSAPAAFIRTRILLEGLKEVDGKPRTMVPSREEIVEGLGHLKFAASRGYVRAMAYLAACFLRGKHMNRNLALAFYWFHRCSSIDKSYQKYLKIIETQMTPEQRLRAEFLLTQKDNQ